MTMTGGTGECFTLDADSALSHVDWNNEGTQGRSGNALGGEAHALCEVIRLADSRCQVLEGELAEEAIEAKRMAAEAHERQVLISKIQQLEHELATTNFSLSCVKDNSHSALRSMAPRMAQLHSQRKSSD